MNTGMFIINSNINNSVPAGTFLTLFPVALVQMDYASDAPIANIPLELFIDFISYTPTSQPNTSFFSGQLRSKVQTVPPPPAEPFYYALLLPVAVALLSGDTRVQIGHGTIRTPTGQFIASNWGIFLDQSATSRSPQADYTNYANLNVINRNDDPRFGLGIGDVLDVETIITFNVSYTIGNP